MFRIDARKIAIRPLRSSLNMFIDNFSGSLVQNGFSVREFRWKEFPRSKTVILHWPHEFFLHEGLWHSTKCALKLAAMRIHRALFGVRFVWVAHNAQPHDAKAVSTRVSGAFLASLDGIVFLSQSSKDAIDRLYALPPGLKTLTTVHGDYRGNMISPPRPQNAIGSKVRLVHFGLIRPYKNIDTLIEAVIEMPSGGVHLTVVGFCEDADLGSRIRSLAANSEDVTLDVRSEYIPDADFERYIDDAHGVVLSYRNILNSGSVFLALSRDRPVLAPRLGSLPELREQVGADWLVLYDGEIHKAALCDFAEWLPHRDPSATCDLSRFSWDRIGQDLSRFVSELHA